MIENKELIVVKNGFRKFLIPLWPQNLFGRNAYVNLCGLIPFLYDMKKVLWALDKALIKLGFVNIKFRCGLSVVN